MTRKLLGYVSVIALLMAFVTYSPVFGQASSSPEPDNKSMLQACDGYPNYGTRIDFEDVPAGTVINTQYLGLGVKFGAAAGGPVTIARTDGARPLDGNILTGQPIFTGDVHASFWVDASNKGYVTQVGASVGYLDQVGTIVMIAYNCDGDSVGSYVNSTAGGDGIEFFSISADEIHEVIFFMAADPAGSDIDCFTFDDLMPCEARIPTLTEWGMIIFCVLLFGWMARVIIRRRKTATVGV